MLRIVVTTEGKEDTQTSIDQKAEAEQANASSLRSYGCRRCSALPQDAQCARAHIYTHSLYTRAASLPVLHFARQETALLHT